MTPQVQKIYDFCEQNPEYKEKIKISMRLKNEILLSADKLQTEKGSSH